MDEEAPKHTIGVRGSLFGEVFATSSGINTARGRTPDSNYTCWKTVGVLEIPASFQNESSPFLLDIRSSKGR